MIRFIGLLLLVTVALINGVPGENARAWRIRSRRDLKNINDIYALDRFISLVEKIERHKLTENKPLKTIVNYIRKLSYDDDKWTTLLGTHSDSLPDGILTPEEKTLLTNMINHHFLGQQEQGVVHTPFGDVAMGRVITGICAGISRNKDLVLSQIYHISANHIDNLYAATIAADLGLTSLVNKVNPSLPLLGPGGTWSPNTQCPQTFNADMPVHSKATNAQILGGIDGFLMGYSLPQWNKLGVRLGQLLRMFYQGGVVYDKQFAACKRLTTFNEMVKQKEFTEQVTLATYAMKAVWNKAFDFSAVANRDIPQLTKTTTQQFYTHIKRLQSGYKCPEGKDEGCSLPANLVFVLDESGSIRRPNYEVEKSFVKKIIGAFDISSYQTRVAVVEYSDNADETIKLGEYSSKSTLVCAVESLRYAGGSTATSEALKAVHDIFENAQSQTSSDHANDPQIMILLTDGKSNGGEALLRPIVESIKKNITGITMVAVGVGNYVESELELIATDPGKHVLTTTDFSKLVSLVKQLRKQTCETSTILKPIPLNNDEASSEERERNEVEVTGYVDPGKARFFTLPSKTLFKAENLSIEIMPSYGTVIVYGSRTNASPGPDNYDFKYNVDAVLRQKRSTKTRSGKRIEFYNICKGYNTTNCPPLFLSVYGENSTNTCSDLDCSVPNQIKFEIKAAQIVQNFRQEKMCFFQLSSEKIGEAAAVLIKILSVNDTVTFYMSRNHHKPDENNHDKILTATEAVKSRMISIPNPCEDQKQCPAIYMSLRGLHVTCNCKEDKSCALPSQVTITVIPKEICFYQLSPEKFLEAKSIDVKISAHNAVELYTSRTHSKPDKSNFTDKFTAPAGNTTEMKIKDPCSGYDSCPPLHLIFVGNKLNCNCTTDETGRQECSLPRNVTVTITNGHSSEANSAEASIPVAVATVSLYLFHAMIV